MSSLFGQVWFWSLLAFLVGALLTWVLLVRPAQQRVQQLEERPQQRPAQPPPPQRQGGDAGGQSAGPPAPVAGTGAGPATEPEEQRPRTQWLERDSVPGDAPSTESADDPKAFFRAEDEAERYGSVTEEGATRAYRSDESYDTDGQAGAVGGVEHRAPESFTAPADEPPGGEYAGSGALDSTLHPQTPTESSAATGDGYDQAGLQTPSMGFAAPVDPTAGHATPAEQAPSGFTPPAEPSWDAGYRLQPDSRTGHTPPAEPWEQSPQDTGPPSGYQAAQETAGDAGSAAGPGTGTAAEPLADRPEPDPDLAAFDGGFDWPEGTAGTTSTRPSTDLPQRRRPANQIKGGFEPPKPIQPSLRQTVRRDQGDSDLGPGALFEPTADSGGQPQSGGQPPAREAAAENVPPGPFGPGSAMPLPGGDRPAPSFSVKASVTALRYCTEDSPQFDQMAPEVWFASVADAERVGFRPLDG